MKRVAIVFDGKRWHVRRLRVIEYDLTHGEKVYRCDEAVSSDHKTMPEAMKSARRYMKSRRRKKKDQPK